MTGSPGPSPLPTLVTPTFISEGGARGGRSKPHHSSVPVSPSHPFRVSTLSQVHLSPRRLQWCLIGPLATGLSPPAPLPTTARGSFLAGNVPDNLDGFQCCVQKDSSPDLRAWRSASYYPPPHPRTPRLRPSATRSFFRILFFFFFLKIIFI